MAVDEDGEEVIHLLLLRLIAQCLDFVNEFTKIEIMTEKMGVFIMITTKYHAELAGEDVEYTLGVAKYKFWSIQISLKMKGGRAIFLKNFRSVLSTNRALSIDNLRRFNKRLHSYMLLHFVIGKKEDLNLPNQSMPLWPWNNVTVLARLKLW